MPQITTSYNYLMSEKIIIQWHLSKAMRPSIIWWVQTSSRLKYYTIWWVLISLRIFGGKTICQMKKIKNCFVFLKLSSVIALSRVILSPASQICEKSTSALFHMFWMGTISEFKINYFGVNNCVTYIQYVALHGLRTNSDISTNCEKSTSRFRTCCSWH